MHPGIIIRDPHPAVACPPRHDSHHLAHPVHLHHQPRAAVPSTGALPIHSSSTQVERGGELVYLEFLDCELMCYKIYSISGLNTHLLKLLDALVRAQNIHIYCKWKV